MPNHVTHKVMVSGDSDEMTAFEEDCFSTVEDGFGKGNTFLDFNKIVPFPKELAGIISGFAIIDGEKVERWREVDDVDVAITDQDRKELVEKYGADCGYDWNINNWGTKWNSYNFHSSYSGSTSIEFVFDTAWSTPQQIFNKLTEMYPNLIFDVSCFDEGWGFAEEGFFSSKENTFDFVEATGTLYEEVYGHEAEHDEED